MDRYMKAIFTTIAISLALITIKMWEPKPAHSGLWGGAQPAMLGEFRNLGQIKNLDERKKVARDIYNRILIVRVRGGSLSIN